MSAPLRPSSALKNRSRQPSAEPRPATDQSSPENIKMADQSHERRPSGEEQEPLLGQPEPSSGDRDAKKDAPAGIWKNLVFGWAGVAQVGIWALVSYVWLKVLRQNVILFSAHPLLNTAGLLLLTQAILILQPTTTSQPASKTRAAYTHATLNDAGLLALTAGLILIEYNKFQSATPHHFESAHAILGLATYVLMGVQGLVGFTALFTPGVYGGAARAKGLYKYHRMSGYAVMGMGVATVAAATGTGFNNVLGIRLWLVLVAGGGLALGLGARVRVSKLGF